MSEFSDHDRALLRALSVRFPTSAHAVAEAAALRATLGLPRGVVHVISDVHGEHAKLRHVITNASGALRPLVEAVAAAALTPDERREFLAVVYYPREVIQSIRAELVSSGRRRMWMRRTLRLQLEVARRLMATYRTADVKRLLPSSFREFFEELLAEAADPGGASPAIPSFSEAMLDEFIRHDRDWAAVRAASRLVRNLSAAEILVAGDLGDRGPRIDRVIDILMKQPNVSLLWGNHDLIWMGACLGHEACLLSVLRFSARYRRAAQLEEGYGILTTPLERLVREVYADDPAERFIPKGEGHRDHQMVARMQKAIAIMQFKAEGQTIRRHPEWNLDHRNLLHRIDLAAGVVEIDGVTHPLLDRNFPTLDPGDPYAFSPEERTCLGRIKESFVQSGRLWEHMSWVVNRGGMWTTRDDALIFHACVPVDRDGRPLALHVDGRDRSGRDLFDALASVVRRAFRKGAEGLDADADWLWYMWGGPRSPLFGKDKLATFEGYFVADKAAREEHKNPYFDLIHDAAFTRRIGTLFGSGDDVLVVNGHVPVKIEKGEQPLKRGGNAITIDGAFSQAYGDRGYTLVLRPDRIELAEHAPFTSVRDVIEKGADIVPTVTTIRSYPRPRTVGDTEQGDEIRRDLANLERLVRAYEEGLILESVTAE
ncbi:MAG: fructose-bisphosphatase class III [Phycisphaerae bacterium]|nr:fructose-bisphosphatase class III [Phycisphaerae bacterium]